MSLPGLALRRAVEADLEAIAAIAAAACAALEASAFCEARYGSVAEAARRCRRHLQGALVVDEMLARRQEEGFEQAAVWVHYEKRLLGKP